jgi:hypothetical protein
MLSSSGYIASNDGTCEGRGCGSHDLVSGTIPVFASMDEFLVRTRLPKLEPWTSQMPNVEPRLSVCYKFV